MSDAAIQTTPCNEYLVIRLKGSWIDREQTKGRVEMLLDGVCEVVKDDELVTNSAWQTIPEDGLFNLGENAKERIKQNIASNLGIYLMKKGLISFVETTENYGRELNAIKITGTVTTMKGVNNE